MERIVLDLALLLLENVPKLIDAVQKSAELSADEKARYMLKLRARVDAAVEHVKSVKFRDVPG